MLTANKRHTDKKTDYRHVKCSRSEKIDVDLHEAWWTLYQKDGACTLNPERHNFV